MRYYASQKATPGYWGYFHVLENQGAGVGGVFSAIWCEWLSGLCHCHQSYLGAQLVIETQPFQVTFGPKIDRPNVVINIR